MRLTGSKGCCNACRFGGMLVVLLCVDMGIKQYIEDTFDRREERKCIVPGIVLRKVYNRGFLLSTLEKYPKIVQGLLLSQAW